MSLILNIESATEVCSVAISKDGEVVELCEISDRVAHAGIITLLIEECLKKAKTTLKNLNAIAISAGPGSYTALRIGTSAAKGICYALEKPLIAVDTLQSIAWGALQQQCINNEDALYVSMIDARRKDVYSAMFDWQNNPVTKTGFESIGENSYKSYFTSDKKIIFSGNGAEKCKGILTSSFAEFSSIVCSASNMASLSHQSFLRQEFEDLAYFVPNYYKAPNITTSKRNPLGLTQK